MVGNRSVYGSVITERGFTGNGTMDIWYNANLDDGLPINTGVPGSSFRYVLRQNLGEAYDAES